jgi:hypothetical protein
MHDSLTTLTCCRCRCCCCLRYPLQLHAAVVLTVLLPPAPLLWVRFQHSALVSSWRRYFRFSFVVDHKLDQDARYVFAGWCVRWASGEHAGWGQLQVLQQQQSRALQCSRPGRHSPTRPPAPLLLLRCHVPTPLHPPSLPTRRVPCV